MMKITFLGTGVSVPFENRAQSSILVEEDCRILIDVGCGCMLRLEQAGVDVCDIDAICLTHNHLDHNGDLLNILKARWLNCTEKLQIYAPEGTRFFLESLLEAYPYLRSKLKFDVFEVKKFKVGNLNFKVMPTIHSIESQAYIIDDTVVVSGDTRAFAELISSECRYMIHELSLPFNYPSDYHTTPENLKENLKFCRAEKIFLVHLYPQTHAVKEEIIRFLDFDAEVVDDLQSVKA